MRYLALLVALAGMPGALQAQERFRFRIASWMEWDDQRIQGGEGYLETPIPWFTVDLRYVDLKFTARLRAEPGADSTVYHAWAEVMQPSGTSPRGRPLFEHDEFRRTATVRPGEAAELRYRVSPESGELATLVLRVEGPRAAFPAGLRWQIWPRGVRFARSNMASFRLSIDGIVPTWLLRVGLAGSGPTRDIALMPAKITVLPGVADTLRFLVGAGGGDEGAVCVTVARFSRRVVQGQRAPVLGRGCVADRNSWRPIEIPLTTGQRLRVQVLP